MGRIYQGTIEQIEGLGSNSLVAKAPSIVEVPVEKLVEVHVERIVENKIEVPVIEEKIVEKEVIKYVELPQKVIEVVVEKIVEVPVIQEKIVEIPRIKVEKVEVIKEVPIFVENKQDMKLKIRNHQLKVALVVMSTIAILGMVL